MTEQSSIPVEAQAVPDQPVARLLHWHGPAHQPIPWGGLCARTFTEFPKDSGAEGRGYWREGAPLFTRLTPAAGVPTLTDERITELGRRHAWWYKKSSDPHHSDTYTFNGCCLHNFARAIERAASPAAQLVAASPAAAAGVPKLSEWFSKYLREAKGYTEEQVQAELAANGLSATKEQQ